MVTNFLKVKRSCLVYYSLSNEKRYNKISKENLVQFNNDVDENEKRLFKKRFDVSHVEDINEYSKNYLLSYKEIMKKEFKASFSRTQQKKISDSTNTFIDVVKHNYNKKFGFNQRMITFVTLTIPENQKHTDKVLVKTLVDFIDHLKKVKNTIILNKLDTNIEILSLKNYVWRAETTEKGNIHFHLLFDTYFNHTTLKRVWNNYLINLGYMGGENSANIHNLKSIKDVGSYVTKYMTKQPLNNEFSELVKSGQVSYKDLENYENSVKFRRPILYTSWGCSRVLKKLSSPTFSGEIINYFNELRDKCTKINLPEDIKDYIKIYKGRIYDILNISSKKLKFIMKAKFNYLYDFLYNKSELDRKNLENLIYLNGLNKDSILEPFYNVLNLKKETFVIQSLFE